MSDVNEMVFCRGNYNDDKEFWGYIAMFLQELMRNDYVATIMQDEVGIIAINYEHNERVDAWGCKNPYWLTEEEYLSINAEEE